MVGSGKVWYRTESCWYDILNLVGYGAVWYGQVSYGKVRFGMANKEYCQFKQKKHYQETYIYFLKNEERQG